MKDSLDKMKQAWQSQCNGKLEMTSDELLMAARFERKVYFRVDMLIIVFFSCLAGYSTWSVFRNGLHEEWPTLISVVCLAWVVGFVLFNRWRRRGDSAHYDESVLSHVELSIKEIEHRMWLDRYNFFWYLLPLIIGCMIPPVVFFAIKYGEWPLTDTLIPLLTVEGFFAVTFLFVYWAMGFGVKKGQEGQRKKLQALRELRDIMLNRDFETGR